MNCEGIRDLEIESLKGHIAPDQQAEIAAHRAGCDACAAERRDTESLLTLLHEALPETPPTPGTLEKIEARIWSSETAPVAAAGADRRVSGADRRVPVAGFRTPVFGMWLRVAAAASVLVAIVSCIALAALPRPSGGPAVVVAETGQSLRTDQPFRAERFSTLLLPDIGTLRLNENSVLRFDGPRAVVLESGEVFADILPSGRGFEIRSGQTLARVHGTRFGVTAPGTVYVVEGKVEVETSQGRLDLGRGQAAVGSRLTEIDDHLRWLAEHERPAVRLRLDPRDQDVVTPGAPLKWRLILESDAIAPLYLGRRRDLSQFLSLAVGDAWVPIDPNAARAVESAASPNGLLRLDVGHPCMIDIDVDPALFREKGRIAVRAAYTSGAHAPAGAWVGSVRSDPVFVEAR